MVLRRLRIRDIRRQRQPPSIGIRMETFDEDPGIRPTVRQFVAYAAAWEPLPDDALPRFPESRHAAGAHPL